MFWISLLFFSTLFFFAHLHVFILNQIDLPLTLKEVLIYVSLLTIGMTLLSHQILKRLPEHVQKNLSSVLITLSFLLWLQGNVLLWPYPPLDGSDINWKEFWIYGLIDSSIWTGLIIWAVLKPSLLYRKGKGIAQFMLIFQSLVLITMFIQNKSEDTWSRLYVPDPKPKFHFSKNKNVIIIIIDEFQSNIFDHIIHNDPAFKNYFDGFTYFRNSLTAFNFTRLAVPGIMTGQYYDNSTTGDSFVSNAYLNASIPRVLHDNGYLSHLYPDSDRGYANFYTDPRISDNFIKAVIPTETKIGYLGLLFDITLMRHLPHHLKRHIFNNDQWLFDGIFINSFRNIKGMLGKKTPPHKDLFEGLRFINDAQKRIQVKDTRNIFKFYHWWGMHTPLRSNERFELLPKRAYNFKNDVAQAKAYLKTCKLFFNLLKQKGIYDNSMIIILGDHGSGRSKDMHINPSYGARTKELDKTSQTDWGFQFDKARGIPVVLFKRFNEHGLLKVSDAPISTTETPKTIMSELNIPAHFPGKSFFDIKSDCTISVLDPQDECNRKRRYGAYKYVAVKNNYAGKITMYNVQGFSWDDHSWSVEKIIPAGKAKR